VVCVDFDGTLAPIVEDPDQAVAHPGVRQALLDLTPRVLAVAVVTGRPVDQVLRLGGLESVADDLAGRGRIEVRGQYGAATWSSTTREVRAPDPPPELERLRERLPRLLGEAGLERAHVEDKGAALAVHARRMSDPEASTAALRELLAPVAEELGLRLEPGRSVVELRAAGGDKGDAVEQLVADLDPAALVFAGDDLGDVAGFEAVARFRDAGGAGLLVCSGSQEERELVARADVVVDGPAGVVALLSALARP
jgi:trehalose 6-phosphate phosphatase